MIHKKFFNGCVLWLLLAALAPLRAQNEDVSAALQRDEVDRAVDRAVQYLLSKQHSTEGWINDRNENRTTMTSLSLLSMAAVGHQATDPTPQGQAMAKALSYVLHPDRQEDNGYYGSRDGSRMYGHGIITLTLAEMIGHGVDDEQDKLILQRCQKAIDLVLRSQRIQKDGRFRGGWRYTPESNDADLSVTVWQLMALRSAKNSGLNVPSEAITMAVDYLKRSYQSRLDASGNPTEKVSGFGYQPGGHSEFATTAAGLLAMQVCGEYESPFVHGAADWLLKRPLKWDERWFFYGAYYYAQGMHQRGGDHAEQGRRLIEELLLPRQRTDGSWESNDGTERNAGNVYNTTMGLLALSVKYHFLPIYQR